MLREIWNRLNLKWNQPDANCEGRIAGMHRFPRLSPNNMTVEVRFASSEPKKRTVSPRVWDPRASDLAWNGGKD